MRLVMSCNMLVTYTDKNSEPMLTRSNLWLSNSNIQFSNSKPLDKLWPVPSLVTYPDNPWFQVLSCTLQKTLTNSESCHMPLSHIIVTCPCHAPPSHPWVSQIFLDQRTHQVPTLSPQHELQPNLTKIC